MPRPKNAVPVIEKTISLPEPLVIAVDLELFSEVEGKVPFGAWKAFMTRLVKEHLRKQADIAELNKALTEAAKNPDQEARHAEMDEILLKYLAATGAHRAVQIFNSVGKWYV